MLRCGRLLGRVVAARVRLAVLTPAPPSATTLTHGALVQMALRPRASSTWQLGRPPLKAPAPVPAPKRAPSNDAFHALLAANAGVYVLWQVAPRDFMIRHFTLQEDSLSRPHTLLTAPFSHAHPWSLFWSCFSLFAFGRATGLLFGWRVAQIYVAGGAATSLAHVCWERSSRLQLAPALGAGLSLAAAEAADMPAGAQKPALAVPRRVALGSTGAHAALVVFESLVLPYSMLFGTLVPSTLWGALWLGPTVYGAMEGGRGRGNTAYVASLCGGVVGGAAYLAWKMRIGRW